MNVKVNEDATARLLNETGFLVHDENSVTQPTQTLEFLGFVLISIDMKPYIKPKEKCKNHSSMSKAKRNSTMSFRGVAEVIGLLVRSFPVVEMRWLFYKQLEDEKTDAFIKEKGNFDEI